MSEFYGPIYANAYDTLYQNKDYTAECDLLERLFKRYGESDVRTVLDLGCGTGNHAIPLAKRGYIVAAVDRSQDMLAAAQAKIAGNNLPITLHQADIRQISLGQTFDAVFMIFSVLGYQLENADALAALNAARRHLRPSGLLIFDVWYGPAVLAQRPSDRVKVIPTPDGKILRTASGELDIGRHTVTVHFRLWQLRGNTLVAETHEEHETRFFFSRELELLLQITGFQLVRLGAFPDFELEPDESTWNVMVVAKATQGRKMEAPGIGRKTHETPC